MAAGPFTAVATVISTPGCWYNAAALAMRSVTSCVEFGFNKSRRKAVSSYYFRRATN